MVELFSPGIAWYAARIRDNDPFSFVRYGEGEWRFIVPELPEKTGRDGFWRRKEAQSALRKTLTQCHDHERYFPAMWHRDHLAAHGWLERMEQWLLANNLNWVKWHNGGVWRKAFEQTRLHVITSAINDSKLPFVLVGPRQIGILGKKVKIAKFIKTHRTLAYWDKGKIEREILAFRKPAIVSFSVGCTTKMLIHSLFPKIGERSFLLDFGAVWDGVVGFPTRPYHRKERIKRNWQGM